MSYSTPLGSNNMVNSHSYNYTIPLALIMNAFYIELRLVAFIRLNLFVKIDLQYWLDKPFEEPPDVVPKYIQGVLF